MKCLVTGGAGFIGSNLAIKLEDEGNEVTIIDNFSSGHRDNIQNFHGTLIEADLSKPLELSQKFDVIFHQAAITDPRYDNDEETLRQNIQGFKNILEFALKNNSKLIYASTANLYGNGSVPMSEDQPKELTSAYGTSKLIMDEMASHHLNDLHIVGLRYFNVFGPNEEHKGRPASMIYHLAKKMRAGENPKLFNPGDQKRDHIYVSDVVSANILALEAPSGIYNVGTGIATSFNELVGILNESLGKNLEIEYIEMPYETKTYQSNTMADTKKAEEVLKFKSPQDLKRRVKEYLELIK